MIETLITAIVAGVSYALSGYAKAVGEKFNYMKFATTLIIGVVTGVIMVFLDLPVAAADKFLIDVGFIALVQHLYGVVDKKILSK